MFEQVNITREVFGTGENLLLCGRAEELPEELRTLKGKVQCVYVDPPFMTGDAYTLRRPFGEEGWKKGKYTLQIPAFSDRFPDEEAYLSVLETLILEGRELLSETGVFCLHLDWRMSARGRLLGDRIFGRDRFLNEIIWSYESGGRSTRFFPRKHDTILLFAKTKKYRFDLTRVPVSRKEHRKNHLSRGVDEEGRSYSMVRVNGKEYRYYDDEPVYPGDVWTDISHLQQRDPERTGYPTQKPVKLLDRLLRPVTVPGDWVVDLCCGSGTTLEAAQKLNCHFAGLDPSPAAISATLGRITPENLTVICPGGDEARLLASFDPIRNACRLEGLTAEHPSFPPDCSLQDRLEGWEEGEIREGVFHVNRTCRRSFLYPGLPPFLDIPRNGTAIMTTDAAGVRRAYVMKSPLVNFAAE